jgi:hypothetical protein
MFGVPGRQAAGRVTISRTGAASREDMDSGRPKVVLRGGTLNGEAAMLDTLTDESFTPHLGTPFRVEMGGATELELKLSLVSVLGGASGARGRRPFSLLFHGPLQPVLPQSIYRLKHPALGDLELFIVPLGPDPGGMRYEAIFT